MVKPSYKSSAVNFAMKIVNVGNLTLALLTGDHRNNTKCSGTSNVGRFIITITFPVTSILNGEKFRISQSLAY
jgi:hypothetical protein